MYIETTLGQPRWKIGNGNGPKSCGGVDPIDEDLTGPILIETSVSLGLGLCFGGDWVDVGSSIQKAGAPQISTKLISAPKQGPKQTTIK